MPRASRVSPLRPPLFIVSRASSSTAAGRILEDPRVIHLTPTPTRTRCASDSGRARSASASAASSSSFNARGEREKKKERDFQCVCSAGTAKFQLPAPKFSPRGSRASVRLANAITPGGLFARPLLYKVRIILPVCWIWTFSQFLPFFFSFF